MRAILSHQSALEYYRTHGTPQSTVIPSETSKLRELGTLATGMSQLASLELPIQGLSAPFHLLVPTATGRSRSKTIVAHVWSGAIARHSLVTTSDEGLLVSSPEFTLLQLSGPPQPHASDDDKRLYERLDPSDPLRPIDDPDRWAIDSREVLLARIAMELLGTYRLATSQSGETNYGMAPLTSYNALAHFPDEIPAARGVELFRATLSHTMSLSFSPMETMLALMLSLPPRLGGYGLPKPVLNVRLRARRGDISSQATIFPDLYWPEQEVLLEYESLEFHERGAGILAPDEKLAHDAERANTLLAMGMKPFVARPRQVLEPDRLDLLARQVAKRLGRPVRTCTGARAERRAKLHALLSPNANDRR